MAFEDLTPNQRRIVIAVIEELHTGRYREEFRASVTGGQDGKIYLIGINNNGKDILRVSVTDVHTLRDEGYITAVSESPNIYLASLKAKAYQQYQLHKDLEQQSQLVRVVSGLKAEADGSNRVALWERHPAHPSGEVFVAGDIPVTVAKTKAVISKIEKGELIVLDKIEPQNDEENKSGNQIYPSIKSDTYQQERFPIEIQESMERFRQRYPDANKVAFIMMQFGKTPAHTNITNSIKRILSSHGIQGLRADEVQYHDDLFPNILTYIYGCGFGVAVFERIEKDEFNPNVALEVGYMFALHKPVCLLKDRTLKTLHVDLVGKLYREFDSQEPERDISNQLESWLKDKGLIPSN